MCDTWADLPCRYFDLNLPHRPVQVNGAGDFGGGLIEVAVDSTAKTVTMTLPLTDATVPVVIQVLPA